MRDVVLCKESSASDCGIKPSFVTDFARIQKSLKATPSKILISNVHLEIDFADNSFINFSRQVGFFCSNFLYPGLCSKPSGDIANLFVVVVFAILATVS